MPTKDKFSSISGLATNFGRATGFGTVEVYSQIRVQKIADI